MGCQSMGAGLDPGQDTLGLTVGIGIIGRPGISPIEAYSTQVVPY